MVRAPDDVTLRHACRWHRPLNITQHSAKMDLSRSWRRRVRYVVIAALSQPWHCHHAASPRTPRDAHSEAWFPRLCLDDFPPNCQVVGWAGVSPETVPRHLPGGLYTPPRTHTSAPPRKTLNADPVLVWCCASLVDAGTASDQHWGSISCLLRPRVSKLDIYNDPCGSKGHNNTALSVLSRAETQS